jgi:hypothetical protein
MPSLRQSIATALDTKKVPAFTQGSVRDLGVKVGLTSPISVRNLMNVLGGLPPAVFTINSGSVSTPGGVTGSAQVGLQSDGAASFRGSVSNPGPGGINYVFALALLDIKDSSGNTLVFANSGSMFNAVEGSSDSWQQDGFNQLIADNWDAAKASRWKATLEVSDNPFQDIVSVIVQSLAYIGVAAVFIFSGSGAWQCRWTSDGLLHCEPNR